jgi:hypothetical protein
MTTVADLEKLGLTATQKGQTLEARLEFSSSQLLNPLTRRFIDEVRLTVVGDRLIVIEPPELVGTPPLTINELGNATDIETRLVNGLNEHIYHLQRRSAELQTLGLTPHVDPETLQLSSTVTAGDYVFLISSDKRGNFRVASASRGELELTVSASQAFELSEFRQPGALADYLLALFGDVPARTPAAPAGAPSLVRFGELARAFGDAALLPPRTALELLVEVRVDGEPYRFAAARVHGRTFRGLLAGAKGKVWAERFDVDQFEGVQALVSRVLSVPTERVQLVGQGGR